MTILLDAEMAKGVENTCYSVLLPGYLARVLLKIEGFTYLIYGVYCPPANMSMTEEQIISALVERVSHTEHTHLIIAGDLNAALRDADRTSPALSPNYTTSRSEGNKQRRLGTKREIGGKARFRVLALHQVLWQERRKAKDGEYEGILSKVIREIELYEKNRKQAVKSKTPN